MNTAPGVVFTNIPNLSLILVIKFMTFVLVKIGPNLAFTKHVLARTIFLILSQSTVANLESLYNHIIITEISSCDVTILVCFLWHNGWIKYSWEKFWTRLMTIVRTKIRLWCFVNTNFTRTNFLTYFYDKNPNVRTKTKIGMLVNTAPDAHFKYVRKKQKQEYLKGIGL